MGHQVEDVFREIGGGAGDGVHFPKADHFGQRDPQFAGANSVELLRAAAQKLKALGWTLINADCTVVLDAPKIAPHRATMEHHLSEAAGGPVTLKGKRTEGVSSLGEGVQCFASALLIGPSSPSESESL